VAYLGNDLQVAFPTYRNIDDISGSFNGVTTSFPLTVDGVAPIPAPVNSQQCLISVNGVVQRPDDSGAEGFLLSGGNIVFASAPAGGVDFFGVILAGADYINIGANFPSGTALVPSITFDSDLDTGIYNPAGNQIGFTTAGVQRLVINSSGQVSGGLGSATTPAFSFLSDTNTGIYSPGADQVAVATNGVGRLFVDASGNVGVGSVLSDLHIASSLPTIRLEDSDVASQASYALIKSSSDGGIQFEADPNSVRSGTAITFDVDGDEIARITPTGVGIGTTSPSSLLELSGVSNPQITLDGTTTSGYRGLIFAYDGTGFGQIGQNVQSGELIIRSGESGQTGYFINFSVNGSDAARIDSSGRLGIGTSSPQAVLESKTASVQPGDAAYAKKSVVANIPYSTNNITSSALAVYDGTIHAADIGYSYDGSGYYLALGTSINTVSAPTERVRIDRLGNVGIGVTGPQHSLSLLQGNALGWVSGAGNAKQKIEATSSDGFDFYTGSTPTLKATLDSSGRLLIGTSSYTGNSKFAVAGGAGTDVALLDLRFSGARPTGADNGICEIRFGSPDQTSNNSYAKIECITDGASSSDTDLPARLVFSTTADGASSPTERMRVNSAGNVLIGTTNSSLGGADGLVLGPLESSLTVSNAGNVPLRVYNKDTSGTRYCIEFRSASTAVGSITHDGTNTSYTTSSDYRLKENVAAVTDGITRLQQLKPSRFNFIADTAKTVDGFLAHEAQAVVPECVTGEKDAVDDDGNPVYQGIDQSKLVPLLTAALQEAIGRIETLEGMVAVNNITIDEQQHQLSTLAARLTALENA
jgi:hypothetical protein